MELEIINKNPIPKLNAETTPANPLTNNNVSAKTDGAKVTTEKINMLISRTPNST